jgi:hypothetical protein
LVAWRQPEEHSTSSGKMSKNHSRRSASGFVATVVQCVPRETAFAGLAESCGQWRIASSARRLKADGQARWWLALNRNTQKSLVRALLLRAEVVVQLEDDTVLGPDAMCYFDWAVREMLKRSPGQVSDASHNTRYAGGRRVDSAVS